MSEGPFIYFLMNLVLTTMALALIVTLTSLCVMLVRSIYRDWDKT